MSASDVDDLLVRARRNLLSAAEKPQLDAAIDALPEARLLLRAGMAFDDQTSALAGDEQLVSRLTRRAEEYQAARSGEHPLTPPATTGGRARTRRFSPWIAAAVSLMVGGVAGIAVAATFWGIPLTASGHEPNAEATRRAAKARIARPTPLMPPPVASAVETSAGPREAIAMPAGTTPYREPVVRPRAATPPQTQQLQQLQAAVDAPSAAQLYSAANQARVRGDLSAAIRGYRDLQLRFPGSAEATASRLTLGNVYLLAGKPVPALAEFRAHQATGGDGFGAESLWGMALAFAQLGRRSEQREALTLLLSRYPSSTYEAAARRKLEERD